jgi:hypothetical protein
MISIGLLIRAVIAFGFGAIAEELGQSGTREWDNALLADLDPSPEYPIRFGKGA